MPRRLRGSHVPGHIVRPILPPWCPQDDQLAAGILLDTKDRKVLGLNLSAVPLEFLLNALDLGLSQSRGGKDRQSLSIGVLADDDIATAKVFEIVGEGAECLEDGDWVPAPLVLNTVPFHGPLTEQIIEVEGEFAHGVFISPA